MRNEIGRRRLVKYLKPNVNSLFLTHWKRNCQKRGVMNNVNIQRLNKLQNLELYPYFPRVLHYVMNCLDGSHHLGHISYQVLLPCSTCWVSSFSSSEIVS